ncbi:EXPORTIN 1/5 [Salix koriyanagi]|uniref:EXPORTIN 1/5 n=1 Tax=Salix koriyanagi TaxID=2511006 RepID=A0A9Q1A3W6_9ROSI|nr:EXPORTIN 1/5 [Salix koriyanagi]
MEESNSNNNIANNVARAIVAALDWNSTPDARNAAVSFLESIKTGDVRILASTSFVLVKRDWSSEIRLHAFKMLQHLVRLRWEELSPTERRNFANAAVELMAEIANSCEEWALKSQTAALVAEIIRREGLELWKELLPSLVSLSSQGPIQAELVSMTLRWLPEDITVHNEDLEGDRRRLLLRGLTESLPEMLPLLYTLLERHFGSALSEVSRQQLDIAKQHAATVTATLNAVNSYAEWAPLQDLAKYGIIYGCGAMLSSPDFRLHACEFFKLVSQRKRPGDASASEFDSAMQYICESMMSLGSFNLQCISGDNNILSLYLQQMLGFFQHFKLALHYQSLLFWLVDDEKRRTLSLVNDDICVVILDISFQRLVKKEKVFSGNSLSPGALEFWSDDFEGKGDFSQYRSKLTELMRLVASFKPLIAGAKISERILSLVKSIPNSQIPVQDLAVMESMQVALENVTNAIFDGSNGYEGGNSEVHKALCRIFEDLLQQLLSLKWTEPTLVEILGHYLDALGPFLKYFPDAVGGVINKLFELLMSIPFAVKDPSVSSARHARLQICTSFIRIAKAADKSVLPHMKGIADTMAYMQREGSLLRGEHNLLGEAFLVMASAAGIQQQQEVLAWLLEPLSQQWTQLEWQNNYLSEPLGLIRLCSETAFMWSIFHTVTFFEKALKRSGIKKGSLNLQNISTASTIHPMASHLSWMLPPLLKLLRAVHSLWSPSISQMLPGEIKAAMTMGNAERYSLLGEGNPKLSKGALTFMDGSHIDTSREGHTETNEADIRNWLKGIRDSGYNVLGLSMTIGDPFFKCLDVHSVGVALMENIQSMEFRHTRQLVHSALIPLVKHCPMEMWEVWLEKLLHPLFIHAQQTLTFSWSSLLHEGKAKVPDVLGILAEADLKAEVMEEKLLRDLTRETCVLLSTLASPGLNTGLPTLEQSGHAIRVDLSSLKELDAFASNSMVGFLLKHNGLAVPALQICLEAFTWTDGEAVSKVLSFCGSVILLAISANNVQLREFVSKDLFSAIIKGLALESNAFISADLVGFCREIFMYLCDRDPAPRQVLLSLPCIKPQDLVAFEEALTKTGSPKEQKQHMKSLLLLATGNMLKALAAQKSVNIITNVTMRPRSSVNAPETRIDEGDTVGLAAIL